MCIIAINVLVFFLELNGGDAFVIRWSVVPADIVAGRHWITILTAKFMHGSWGPEIGDAGCSLLRIRTDKAAAIL